MVERGRAWRRVQRELHLDARTWATRRDQAKVAAVVRPELKGRRGLTVQERRAVAR